MCTNGLFVASSEFVPNETPEEQAAGGDAATAGSLVAAARLYYHDQLSQQEIAERLGVSRSTVSRLLRLARDQGIVHIEIRPPSPIAHLRKELEAALDLRRAVVVPTPSRAAGVQVLVGPALGEIERLRLGAGDVPYGAVKGGAFEARFNRAAAWQLLQLAEYDEASGAGTLRVSGGEWPLRRAS
jgi:predicted DNA-binding protein (UPF0251 family)